MFIPRRLDKYLRDSTSLSVVEIREACRMGRVTVSIRDVGPRETPLEDSLIFEDDLVRLDDEIVGPASQRHYLVLNKPRHITSTARDPDGRTDLLPWLRQMPEGVFPIGRLDRETSGALLFTDDGDFANAILQPDHHTQKLYWLWIDGHIDDGDRRLEAFVKGIQIDNDSELLRASSAVVHHRTPDYTELHVTLDEGKNRQIRKMCNKLQLKLVQLHRKSVGSLNIEAMPIGAWRQLLPSELESLWASCGGVERVVRNKLEALRKMALRAREASQPHARLEAWFEWLDRDAPARSSPFEPRRN